AAMHPFLDGNGRTARALEALMLQRAGLRDTCFIAMSNYYYDEKRAYLAALSEVRARKHDLTPFLVFGLKGVEIQSRRLLAEIQHQVSKELFRTMMYDLFHRLKTPRRLVIAERQIEILKLLLETDWMNLDQIERKTAQRYASLDIPRRALTRDLNDLIHLGAVKFERLSDKGYRLAVRLQWPTEITETAFFDQLKALPKAKTHPFLQ
ncbi:MAG: Fic family protein, partial [Terriglobia bacterium]